VGFANSSGQKKLKLVALGNGSLGWQMLRIHRSIRNYFQLSRPDLANRKGLKKFVAIGEEDIRNWLALVHRHESCFNTPIPQYLVFLMRTQNF
jgi:hypothetical protein